MAQLKEYTIKVSEAIFNSIQMHERIVIYVMRKGDADDLQLLLPGALVYRADMSKPEKDSAVAHFHSKKSIMISTTAFGTGINFRSVRATLFYGGAWQIKGFHQQSGRGGRDFKPSLAVIITAPFFRKLFPAPVDNDFWELVDSSKCIRQIISKAIDGEMSLPCLGIKGALPCKNCQGDFLLFFF